MKTLVVLIFSVLASTAWARMGENAEQLAKRYGTPIAGTGTEMLHFKKNDIYVTATLWKGVCHSIFFSNRPPSRYTLGEDFVLPDKVRSRFENEEPTAELTQDQVQKLLEVNASGSKWANQESGWRTKNGWYWAKVDYKGVRIETAEYTQRKTDRKDKPNYDPDRRIDGF